MYKCDICGREIFKKIRMKGYTLCSKHMHQILKYGHPLDNNPRTVNDLNDYNICGDIVYFNLYDQNCMWVGNFIIDLADIELVKYHKWRYSHNHIVTGSGVGGIRELSHIILGIPKEQDSMIVVDHINGTGGDNRRCNLRVCTQAQNMCNKYHMSNNLTGQGLIGVIYDSARNRYAPEIRFGYQRLHLGRYRTIEEAAYVRLIAEKYLFKEYANQEQIARKEAMSANIPEERKRELENYTISKIQLNFGNQLC